MFYRTPSFALGPINHQNNTSPRPPTPAEVFHQVKAQILARCQVMR